MIRSEISSLSAGPRAHGHQISVRSARSVDLTSQQHRKIAATACEIRSAKPAIDDIAAFGPGVRTGIGSGSAILIGDIAEIPLMTKGNGRRLDYRLGWLARSGDLVVIGGPSDPAFEVYQRQILKSPGIRYFNVDPDSRVPRRATTTLCLRDPLAFQSLLGALDDWRGVTLQAHITTGTVWALASRLNKATGQTIHVAGPPPLLSHCANNKIWFGATTERLLGSGSIPAKRTAQSGSTLTRHVSELARKWDRLVIKVPDSAGSEGNLVLASSDVRGLTAAGLYQTLMQGLSFMGQPPRFPMLVEVWDANVLTSPSVQTWIPRSDDGPPVVEGVFEQMLSGDRFAFDGAIDADLPDRIDDQLCQEALQIAVLFQRLGYFGRCSFDAIVTGVQIESATVNWIECNARWGGVSLPMTLANRLAAPNPPPHYAIVQTDRALFALLAFDAVLRSCSDLLLRPGQQSGVLFLSPNLMASGSGCHFMSFAGTRKAATDQTDMVLKRLETDKKA